MTKVSKRPIAAKATKIEESIPTKKKQETTPRMMISPYFGVRRIEDDKKHEEAIDKIFRKYKNVDFLLNPLFKNCK